MASRSETLQVRDISFQGAQGEPTRLRAEVCIPGQKSAEIWFEYNASLPEPDNSGDPFLLCLLHRAMHLGLDLSIDGPVHPQLLRNLEWMIEL